MSISSVIPVKGNTTMVFEEEEEEEEFDNKLNVVTRMPQEGKTFICISSITSDTTRNIHIVLTMNTLASGMQFFGRMEEQVGSRRIIVFNSKKSTAGRCWHAKIVGDIFALLHEHNDIKVIVCCAHTTRLQCSIPKLFTAALDSVSFLEKKQKFVVHIDEAHKYIDENRECVRNFNASPIVSKIIGYSGSPDKIWVKDKNDKMFYKCFVMDVEKELNIIRSPNYFGVKNCNHLVHDYISHDEIIDLGELEPTISSVVFERAKVSDKSKKEWYGCSFPFSLGNEILYLSYIKYILPQLKIQPDKFSYHFVPAYTRKVTHYQTVDLLLQCYPTSNVIVINGNGMELFRYCNETNKSVWKTNCKIITQLFPSEKTLLEPSYMIQKMIESTRNCPTFVTGFTCVGMSVTLINENIGNFDNVIVAHQHLNKDCIYQLCRFLFNYNSWSAEGRANIKKTNFRSLSKTVLDTCLEYEEHVERLSTDFAGKSCTLREIDGLPETEPELQTKREKKKEDMLSIKLTNPEMWKKFKVYDNNDKEMWLNANNFYKSIVGKDIKGKCLPKLKEDGFYHCSTMENVIKQRNDDIKKMTSQSWSSTLPVRDHTEYARVFVGYDDLDDNTDYTIYIKYAQLEKSAHTQEILARYYGKKPNLSENSISQEVSDIDE